MKTVLFIVALVAVLATTAFCGNESDLNRYKVTGVNTKTKLRVCGDMAEIDKEGRLHGLLYDMLEKVPVTGTWSGKGMIEAIGPHGHVYELAVVEK